MASYSQAMYQLVADVVEYQSLFFGRHKNILIIGLNNERQNMERYPNLNYTILDKNIEYEKLDFKYYNFIQCDLNKEFPHLNSKFDLIIGNFILEYIKDKREFLANLEKVLSSNGELVLCLWYHNRELDNDFKMKLKKYFSKSNLQIYSLKLFEGENVDELSLFPKVLQLQVKGRKNEKIMG
ncbi:class I SAM-dependent methyltransferase [Streptococcus pasteurianus]|uniref:class I SAM-dependent methyltransferase n=1 Tax=Bacillota TaxID=1239 RepID=UPI000E3F369B|nr:MULTISPECIES: class I SAM-dependent methyltransferase [Bacillota]MDY4237168.1 class I SAM-dependent methyltransferase [Bacilli bacterium]MCO7183249.1 class I SAM-dependent methyltransferase [Streptococcus gallolyticus]MDV5118378.1 class I SAM-dependent methyltransferase [Streptococcus pasteurianus]MDV5123056.1 class I SAM-dependent methyltransferase [Streptococcus pasteurianus]MDV5134735.1 class I SAM-dependent methyltransferase [Streptococcus pasteurianus]